jgi:hypothetical protein
VETLDSLFAPPQKHIEWGEEAFSDGERIFQGFFGNKDNFPCVREKDPETGGVRGRVYLANPLPDGLERKLTEIVNNARHSFDQSLFAACAAIGKPVNDGHFPWAINPTDLDKWKLVGKHPSKPKIPPELWDVLRSHEPYYGGDNYTGGNNIIRELAALANSKHTIGIVAGMALPRMTVRDLNLRTAPGFQFLGGPWDSVKNEGIIWRDPTGQAEISANYQITFHVRFDVPPPLGAVDASAAARDFLDKAQRVLKDLKQRAREVRGG